MDPLVLVFVVLWIIVVIQRRYARMLSRDDAGRS